MLYLCTIGIINGKSSQESITFLEEGFSSLLQLPVGSSSLGTVRGKILRKHKRNNSSVKCDAICFVITAFKSLLCFLKFSSGFSYFGGMKSSALGICKMIKSSTFPWTFCFTTLWHICCMVRQWRTVGASGKKSLLYAAVGLFLFACFQRWGVKCISELPLEAKHSALTALQLNLMLI